MSARLSVAMIAKNEEGVIGRCLSCVEGFADEVVVVDTGSSDRTCDVASAHSRARVFKSERFTKETPMSDFEFGVARNESIRRCSGDWVVWVDCDDVVGRESMARIREAAESSPDDVVHSFRVSHGQVRFQQVRMFRNGRGILFDEGHACHEYLDHPGCRLVPRLDIEVAHLPARKSVSSLSRNVAILEKDLFARGRSDARTLFYLANAYREAGRHSDASAMYERYLGASRWAEERFFARHYRAICLRAEGRPGEAKRELLLSLAEDSRFADSLCALGDMSMGEGDSARAILWYQMALATPVPEDSMLFVNPDFHSRYPAAQIAKCMAAV